MRLGEAPADVAYGLLFYVRDGANLVYFKVAQTGEYALLERTGGDFTDLIPASPTNALDTRPGAANRLAVDNSAGVILLYINRQEIARYALPAASGTAGLAASLFAGQSATIYFDDVMICSAKCR